MTAETPRVTAAGKTLSVKVTPSLHDDLAVITRGAVDQSDAVRRAIRQAADICRTAWAHGVCAPGTTPVLDAYSLQRQPGYTPPISGYDAPSDAPARPVMPPPYPRAGRTTVGGSDT